METISSSVSSIPISTSLSHTKSVKHNKFLNFQFNALPASSFLKSRCNYNPSKSKLFTATTSPSSVSTEFIQPPEPELELTDSHGDKFDWYAQWCPIMPVCDLDKRKPHAQKVMGIDVVVWWDRNVNAWKVFDDMCPHRLAPLSEGRIDQWGRLQCVYHGWCFNGSGDCKFIPQAPTNGPPVHTSKKACVGVYPSTIHHDIVWFWPNTDSQFKDIIIKKKPLYISELDDPTFTKLTTVRNMPYGYEVMIANLMDPAHISYAHYGIFPIEENKEKNDREGGRPLDMSVQKLNTNGFIGKLDGYPENADSCKFIAPFIFYAFTNPVMDQGSGATFPSQPKMQKRTGVVFICIPVSPGRSRLILININLSNMRAGIGKLIPRWINHMPVNLVLDSDLYLLHLEEQKIMELGANNWQKTCFVATKADAIVVGFRRWLKMYGGGQVDWRGKYSGALPPTPPREQLMDRYWSHVVNCSSCNAAHKSLNALEVILQVISIVSIGFVAATKQSAMSTVKRSTLAVLAILCFAAARFLSNSIYKNFHFHDYYHA